MYQLSNYWVKAMKQMKSALLKTYENHTKCKKKQNETGWHSNIFITIINILIKSALITAKGNTERESFQ